MCIKLQHFLDVASYHIKNTFSFGINNKERAPLVPSALSGYFHDLAECLAV